jgi:hypothetical protein
VPICITIYVVTALGLSFLSALGKAGIADVDQSNHFRGWANAGQSFRVLTLA